MYLLADKCVCFHVRTSLVSRNPITCAVAACVLFLTAASAQDSSMGGMQMPMKDHAAAQLPSPHAGSGTGWQPSSVPEPEWMLMRGGWELMAHGVIFADYNQQGGPRGAGKAASVTWSMRMEQHKLGAGAMLFRQLSSREAL